jgi:diguanylate cyclase (GGDEF)-like protein
MSKRAPEEVIVIAMCAVAASGLLPFALMRFLRGDLTVFWVDILGGLLSLWGMCYVLKSHNYRLVGFIVAFASVSGMSINVYTLGESDVYFLYPVFVATCLVTSPRLALALCMTAIGIISVRLIPDIALFDYTKIVGSLTACIIFAYIFATQRNRQRDMLTKLSSEDALTGAGNRRALHTRIDQLVATHARNNESMSLILLDIDNFKQINDLEGHQVGDTVLRAVSNIIESRIRVTDSHYRYGGDEFVVLATRADLETASQLAEEIRHLIVEQLPRYQVPITVSIGVAQYRTNEKQDAWLNRADKAMYKAKSSGKNLVAHEQAAQLDLGGVA